MQKLKNIMVASVLVLLGLSSVASGAEEQCPDIDGSLRFELYKTHKEFEIAFVEVLSGADQMVLAQYAKGICSCAVELNSSIIAVLLKKKRERKYMVVLAEDGGGKAKQKWSLHELGVFSDDVPFLGKPRGGFYSDVVTRERMTVTRDTLALKVSLPENGKEFVYKVGEAGAVQKCQVK